MEVEFDDSALQKFAENERKLIRKYGEKCAKKLMRRLNDLRAVDCVPELSRLPGRWHELSADRAGQWASDLEHPLRLIVRPTPPIPRRGDGGIVWREVVRVTVVEIDDYH